MLYKLGEKNNKYYIIIIIIIGETSENNNFIILSRAVESSRRVQVSEVEVTVVCLYKLNKISTTASITERAFPWKHKA